MIATEKKTIKRLLTRDLEGINYQLGFTLKKPKQLSYQDICDSIGIIDKFSHIDDDKSRKIVITCSALLWEYGRNSWPRIAECLILFLSRAGFSPSTFMIDTGAKKNNKYSAVESYINKLAITRAQMKDEIYLGNTCYLLTGFQRKVWDALTNHDAVAISAPTSAGKSYILLLKIVSMLRRHGGRVVYIVPTLSLVAQVASDFRKLLDEFALKDCEVFTCYDDRISAPNVIYVLTQEKAINATSDNKASLGEVLYLVLDEIQNIERVNDENDQRAKTLFELALDFRFNNWAQHIVIAGPRLVHLDDFGKKLFGVQVCNNEVISSPVLGLTYSILKNASGFHLKQYCDLFETPITRKIIHSEKVKKYGNKIYDDEFYEYLSGIVSTFSEDSTDLIFSPTAPQARNTATNLASRAPAIDAVHLASLIKFLQETVHKDYDLCNALASGFAYHHGKMPMHVRKAIEYSASRGLLKSIACTTTLMQGVNLPTQNVIIRNPNLFIRQKKDSEKLTPYEIANLRGRAGRLLKDFIGRTFILEEQTFIEENDDQHRLFDEETKNLGRGYAEKYEINEAKIDSALDSWQPASDVNSDYSYIISYIRHITLKHGNNAQKHLESIGLKIGILTFDEVKRSLETLSIPKEICLNNRYWDPLDLDRLMKTSKEISLPNSIQHAKYTDLYEPLKFLKDNFPYYFEKHVVAMNDKRLVSVCKNAVRWGKGWSLKKILTDPYYDDPDKIEKCIATLQNTIAYQISMLLRPLYDIKKPESIALSCLEFGASKPIERMMIANGIPRETALYLHNSLLKKHPLKKDENFLHIRDHLKRVWDQIPFWHQIQLESLISSSLPRS